LTFLVGTLGKGAVGEAFDSYGYATTFRWTAAFGFLSAVFVLLEWARVTAQDRRARKDTAPSVDDTKGDAEPAS
jgi:PAT family beta-lactamase induction signal transducer AmpG